MRGGGAQRSLPLVVELLGVFPHGRDDALARGSLAAAKLPPVLLEGVDGVGLGPVHRDGGRPQVLSGDGVLAEGHADAPPVSVELLNRAHTPDVDAVSLRQRV